MSKRSRHHPDPEDFENLPDVNLQDRDEIVAMFGDFEEGRSSGRSSPPQTERLNDQQSAKCGRDDNYPAMSKRSRHHHDPEDFENLPDVNLQDRDEIVAIFGAFEEGRSSPPQTERLNDQQSAKRGREENRSSSKASAGKRPHRSKSEGRDASEGSRRHTCSICPASFSTKYRLEDHKRNKHGAPGVQQSFPCNECGVKFTRRYSLDRHVREVHNKSEAHQCHCGSTFGREFDLHKHIREVHEQQETFKCDKCEKTFTNKGSLTKHMRTVHAERGAIKCLPCNKTFSRKDTLRRHNRSHHQS